MTQKEIVVREYKSPCGVLVLGSFDNKLCMCDWKIEKHHNRIRKRLADTLKAAFNEGSSPVIEQAALQLDEFFTGKRTHFNLPLLFSGTDFQKTVWSELLRIPFGSTVSYSILANNIGRPKGRSKCKRGKCHFNYHTLPPCYWFRWFSNRLWRRH